ncbi:MAG TPA: hypothetical protein VHA15_03045 [Burkholderiales bacterium]|nr:hypothetical protein [Burkholderiales bacterium]
MAETTPPDTFPNAADYVDSLLRPPLQEKHFKWKFIEGRRMRDKFVGQVIVPEESTNPEPTPG